MPSLQSAAHVAAKPAQVIHSDEGETTLIHFGLIVPSIPSVVHVMIQQESEKVILDKNEWNEVKANIDQFFEGIENHGTK